MTGQAMVRAASSLWRRVWLDRVVVVRRVAWRRVLAWALLGWFAALALVALDYRRTSEMLGPLVVTERIMPAAAVLEADLGPRYVNSNGPHDGAYFYVIARQPMHPAAAAEGLDHPRYRLQRILFPVLGWLFHPSGGGEGLVWSLAAVGAVGVLLAGISAGTLSMRLGGPAWLAAVIPILGGCTTSLRITTPDPLAVALAMFAVASALSRRTVVAVLFGIAAVLTKETMLVVLLGYAMWQRGRVGAFVAGVAGVVVVGWYALLRVLVDEVPGQQMHAFTTPFAGWVRSIEYWGSGAEPRGFVWMALALIAAAAAVARGRLLHPLTSIVVLHLALLIPLVSMGIAPERSAGRNTLPMVAAALVVLFSAKSCEESTREPVDSAAPSSA